MNGKDIVYRTIVIRGQSEGIDKVTADLNKLAGAHEGVTIASEETEKSTRRLEQAMQRSMLRFDAVARAQNEIEKQTKLANKAVREELISREQADAHLARVSQHYSTASTAAKGFAQQTGLARHELVNLGRQAQDVGVSLASGQSPLMVLVQQGTQIADVFATSGGTVRGFFSQAIGWAKAFLSSTGGIVTAVLAVGGAAIYAVSQFATASTTIEEALKEQNRLLKEGKALIDERTSAEARAQLQAKDQTQFETLRNLVDLQLKLNRAMEDAAKLAASRATTPTGGGMPEMGEAPTGFAPLKDPGLDKITEAFQRLNAAREAGLPGLKEFNAELSRIGMAYPELATTVEELIKAGRAGMDLEFATMRAKAMSDALAGVATNAQLAAVGLGSVAQFNLNNLGAQEAAAATERMAVATMEIVNTYPGITVATAQTLANLTSQMTTQEANNVKVQLEADYRRINATYQEEINRLLREGLILTSAVADAEQNRQAALTAAIGKYAQINALQAQTVDYAITAYEKELGITSTWKESAGAAQDKSGAASAEADALKKQREELARQREELERQRNETDKVNDSTERLRNTWQDIPPLIGNAVERIEQLSASTRDFVALSLLPGTQFKKEGYTSSWDPLATGRQKQSLEDMYGAQNIEAVRSLDGSIKGYNVKMEYWQKKDDELGNSLDSLTKSTDSLNETMQGALSPFYSQDPRTTKLGFRAGTVGNPDWLTGAGNANPLDAILGRGATAPGMANGGSFVVGGGYSANDNKLAMFPVASGEEVIVNRSRQQGRGGQVVNIDNRIIIQGGVDADTLSKLKISRYQQAQRMRAGMARAS